MAVLVVCPACGGKLNAPSELVGRMAKCPQCGQTVKVIVRTELPTAKVADEETPLIAGAPRRAPTRKPKTFPSESDTESDDVDALALDNRAGGSRGSETSSPGSRISYGLGIPSLILGIIALLFSWIPLVGLLSIPLSGLGLLLGIAGLVIAIIQGGRGMSFPIAGSAISLSALATVVFSLGLFSGVFKGFGQTAKPTGLEDILAASGGRQDQDQNNPPRKTAEEKPLSWADASKGPVRQGDIRVQVGGVAVRNIRIKDVLGEETVSPTKNLTIQLFIENTSSTRKIDFLGWSGGGTTAFALTDLLAGVGRDKTNTTETPAASGRNTASLTDNFKNQYKRVSLELGAQIPGQITTAISIYPGKQIEDLLVFEPPLDNVQFLRLELPAGAFEGAGSLRLQIPKGMIRR